MYEETIQTSQVLSHSPAAVWFFTILVMSGAGCQHRRSITFYPKPKVKHLQDCCCPGEFFRLVTLVAGLGDITHATAICLENLNREEPRVTTALHYPRSTHGKHLRTCLEKEHCVVHSQLGGSYLPQRPTRDSQTSTERMLLLLATWTRPDVVTGSCVRQTTCTSLGSLDLTFTT